jgi:hypothetical protein
MRGVEELEPVRGRRRGPLWTPVSHGLHRPAGDDRFGTTLRAWQLVLPPSSRFTHLTAAEQYGWWMPPVPAGLPVWAAIHEDESRPRREGLRAIRQVFLAKPEDRHGVRLDPPADTILACARDLGLLDVVVLMDAALHAGTCTHADLEVAARRRRRGVPLFRQALELADGRSESLWETLLRLLHRVCEIDVEPQYRLVDADGDELARADLWIKGTNALHEYDGEHHLDRPRQRKDLARARRINNVDWLRRGYTNVDVLHRAVGIVRDADLSLGRPHRPDRVRKWHRLLKDSLVTPSGRARLLRRIADPAERNGDERHRHAG